jgi:Zn-dependent protease with chaperone function
LKNERFAARVVLGIVLLVLFALVGTAHADVLWKDKFEQALGRGAAPQLVEEYGGEYIPPIWERMWLEEIFTRLAAQAERREIEYSLSVLNTFEQNAFALPGGYIFLTRGLLQLINGDETKLAAVLGHEIAHVEKRHGINAVLRQLSLTIAFEMGMIWLDVLPPELVRVASVTLLELLKRGWGRDAEYEADLLGQHLAVRAGFDPIGAVAMLDDLLDADPEQMPTHIFSSHPDTRNRRNRVEENIISFWSEPEPLGGKRQAEIAELGRILTQNRRTDPRSRFALSLSESPLDAGLLVYDQQRQETLVWLNDKIVQTFSWSPTGETLAVVVHDGPNSALVLLNRHGYVVEEWSPDPDQGTLTSISWSPDGKMLALGLTDAVVVTYVDCPVQIPVSGVAGGTDPIWLDDGLHFRRGELWYRSEPPTVEPVEVSNPVPRVLQRRRILSPTVIREEGSIRLTRPSLTLP